MITNFFISFVVGLINVVSFVVPAVNLSGVFSAANSGVGDFFNMLGVASPIIDPVVLGTIILTGLALEGAALAFRIANYVFNHIPLIGAFG